MPFTKIVKFMALGSRVRAPWGQTYHWGLKLGIEAVESAAFQISSSLLPELKQPNCLCDYDKQPVLYQNCEIGGPGVQGSGPMGWGG